MRRRITNAEVKELLILSRSQKCCRFKIGKATRSQNKKKSLSNLHNKKNHKKLISKESNREWVVMMAVSDEDSPKNS